MDHRTYEGNGGRPKKSIDASLNELAKKGKTGDPLLLAIDAAYTINQACGGAVITPWEIAELEEQAPEWIWASRGIMYYRLGQKKNQHAAAWQAGVYQRWRESHPAYRRS